MMRKRERQEMGRTWILMSELRVEPEPTKCHVRWVDRNPPTVIVELASDCQNIRVGIYHV